MTPEQLKASILQYAIQGKLVEQRPEEGSAEDLYKQIQEEKSKLIKEGKIKKEKPLADITEDEIPFDIPDNWKWVRLGQCGCFERGSGIKKDEVTPEGFPCVRYGQLYTTYKTRFSQAVSHIPNEVFDKCHKVYKNDILMALTGENEYDIALAVTYEGDEELAMGGDMTRFFGHCMNPIYLTYVINSRYGILCKSKMASGNIIVHISNDKLATIPIPLPPLEEQHRIVAKIEEMLPYVERYAASYEKLEQFNSKFPEDMKKSILQYAIMGKLVEQRPEEGTAEELYQEIQEEKQKLIKEGKIKKEKPLAEITEDEIPFDIPDSWKWIRLVDCVSILGDGLHGTPVYSVDGEYYFINGNNLDDGIINIKQDTKKVSFEEFEKYKKELNENTVLVSINGTLGNIAFYNEEKVMLGKSACYFNLIDKALKYYIYWVIKTDYFLKYATTNATGSTIKNVSLATMKSFMVPLPPLEEQHRIVAKIEELLPYCDQLLK